MHEPGQRRERDLELEKGRQQLKTFHSELEGLQLDKAGAEEDL